MNIIITGSVAYDYLMTFPGKFQEHILADQLDTISLSFLVDKMVRLRGGIAPNISYTMALLGGNPKPFATVGTDFEEYRLWLEGKGVDTTYLKVVEDKYTASFFATTDQVNSQLASFYPGAMGDASIMSIKDLGFKPDLVVVSPNDPAAMDKFVAECKEEGIDYLYDPSQQLARIDGETIRTGVEGAKFLFVNEYEFGLIQKKSGLSEEDVISQVEISVVTLGEKGSVIYQGENKINISAVVPDKIVDPTGAGDAFRGGFLTGYNKGWDLQTCGQMGSLTATYCLENDGPQGHHYTKEMYVKRYREHFNDNGLLDELLVNE
ncbi:MAG: carbohydrate kinase family protein [Chloroflexi bacterium]|jgi:adenosine kinase|nr:carbohydrate kinase family protein [Chloroflexota bacterium]MBT3668950.1 carbohydrate kinase family protein [Chloroflexota bacterium]MBT4305323.1 carbohydrate kinase family protein [Chloroflexota bacterium]MBT4532469.1 carbohydrate kinase family protein [Chloroflexota bacterium]MBT4683130.1 carbohydrate kinase family protein [Chloroflexota bacterium]